MLRAFWSGLSCWAWFSPGSPPTAQDPYQEGGLGQDAEEAAPPRRTWVVCLALSTWLDGWSDAMICGIMVTCIWGVTWMDCYEIGIFTCALGGWCVLYNLARYDGTWRRLPTAVSDCVTVVEAA